MAFNNTTDESYLWTDSSIILTWIQGPPNNWKTSVSNTVAIIQEETSSAIWRHVPSQSNPADLISRGIEPTTLSTSTLWWKGPQRLSQELSSWPTTEVNTTKLIRVIAHCRRFINNCRHPKANRHTTTLSTQDLDQVLTCCVKMVQQISYAQEMKEVMEQQGVAATRSQNIASNQLHEIYKMLQFSSQTARVQDFLATEGCDWKFIPPHGPHFGGLWEAAVKYMKHRL